MADRIPSAQQVQEAVARVYARPEFQEHHGIREWLGQLFSRAWLWIADKLEAFGHLKLTHPVIWWLVVGWLVLTVLALFTHLVWSTMQAAKRGDDAEPASAARKRAAKPRTAADWEAEAARLAGEGRVREAAAALYQALLLRLDGRGAVRFDPAKTPGDYRREARQHPEAAQALGSFLRLFEPVAFGGRGLDLEGWERMRVAAAAGGAGA